MKLQEIIDRCRLFLEEPTTQVEAQNVSETFEGYSTGAPPAGRWVSSGAQPPRVETQGGQKQLKVQAVGASGKVGIDISTQIASDSVYVRISFDLFRTAASADVVNLIGINEVSTLDSAYAFQLLRLSTATPATLEVNTQLGWFDSLSVITTATTYALELRLFSKVFDVFVDGSRVATNIAYPTGFQGTTFGYLYFLGNAHAAATCFLNDLNSTGHATVFGEVTWTNEELTGYANEAVGMFRSILPSRLFERYMAEHAQNQTSGTNNYPLPAGMQRLLGATMNANAIAVLPVAEQAHARALLTGHYLETGMEDFPIGWVLDGKLYVFPTPTATVSDGIRIYYLPPVTEMALATASVDEPEIPSDLHQGVVYFTCIRAREKTGDDTTGLRADLEALLLGAGAKETDLRQ